MLAGWSAIAAAILTVTGLVTLLAYFGTGSPLLGRLNDLNTTLMALATVPIALALGRSSARGPRLLGIAGGAGMAVAALGFPVLGREHPAIFLAGAVALIGLVGFFAWAGVLLLQARLVVGRG